MRKLFAAAVAIAVLGWTGAAQGQVFGGTIRLDDDPGFDGALSVSNGECVFRQRRLDGRIEERPCDRLSAALLDEFEDEEWDDFCERFGWMLTDEQYERYCGLPRGLSYDFFGGRLRFSGISVHLDPGYTFTAPFYRGFLATESGGSLVNPAYDLSYRLEGFTIGMGVDAQMSFDRFGPMKLSTGFSYGSLHGEGTAGNIQLDNMGITSVGEIPGVFVNAPTDILDTRFIVDRIYGSINTRIGIPLSRGHYDFGGSAIPGMDYELYALAGKRFGFLTETETTTITTSTPAYGLDDLTDIRYDTRFDGMFAGAQVGLGLDKQLPLPDRGVSIRERFSVLGGFDFYRFRVEDSVEAAGLGGALNHASSNSFEVSATVPTLELSASLGIESDKWYAGVTASLMAGLHPELDYNRPDSVAPATPLQPTLELLPSWSSAISGTVRLNF